MRADNASCGVPSVASGSAQTLGHCALIEEHARACSRMWVGGERELEYLWARSVIYGDRTVARSTNQLAPSTP
eukprot:7376199-Prymnesium_polylepis.1